MDSRWFKEDRALPKKDQPGAQAESLKALQNSTFFQRRLERILEELYSDSQRADEDFSKPNWELHNVANISRRKLLLEIKKIIQL
jgi:hypothetical protein